MLYLFIGITQEREYSASSFENTASDVYSGLLLNIYDGVFLQRKNGY